MLEHGEEKAAKFVKKWHDNIEKRSTRIWVSKDALTFPRPEEG